MTDVYIAAKADPWDSDTATAEPESAQYVTVGDATRIVMAPVSGALDVPEATRLRPGDRRWPQGRLRSRTIEKREPHQRTPSRWAAPMLRLAAPPVSSDEREAFSRALAEMSRSSCFVLPPSATFEIIAPRYPCRTLLTRTALGLVPHGAGPAGMWLLYSPCPRRRRAPVHVTSLDMTPHVVQR